MDYTRTISNYYYFEELPIELNYIIFSELKYRDLMNSGNVIWNISRNVYSFYQNLVRIKYGYLYPGFRKILINEPVKYVGYSWGDLYRDLENLNYDRILRVNEANIYSEDWYMLFNPHEKESYPPNNFCRELICGSLIYANFDYDFVDKIHNLIGYNLEVCHDIYYLFADIFVKELQFNSKYLELKIPYNYKHFTKPDLYVPFSDRQLLLLLFRNDKNLDITGIERDKFIYKSKQLYKKTNDEYRLKINDKFLQYFYYKKQI